MLQCDFGVNLPPIYCKLGCSEQCAKMSTIIKCPRLQKERAMFTKFSFASVDHVKNFPCCRFRPMAKYASFYYANLCNITTVKEFYSTDSR